MIREIGPPSLKLLRLKVIGLIGQIGPIGKMNLEMTIFVVMQIQRVKYRLREFAWSPV